MRTSPTAPSIYWQPFDAWYSVIKAFFFAGAITLISCYMGFNTQQGAEGVGKSTTGAVVTSSVLDPAARHGPRPSCCSTNDRTPRTSTSASAQQVVLDGVDFDGAGRRDGGAAGALGHRQERAAQAHHRADPAGRRARSSSTGRTWPSSSARTLAELRTTIGYVFQNGALFDSMNVFENIRLGITDEEQYRDLEYCRRAGRRSASSWSTWRPRPAVKYPAQLSGGMRKRVGIARAIAGDAQVPAVRRADLRARPGQRRHHRRAGASASPRELGVTSVMVTHDVRGAFRVADRLALLSDGKIVHAGHAEGVPGVDRSRRSRRSWSAISTTSTSPPETMDLHYQKEVTVGTMVLVGVGLFWAGTMWLKGATFRSPARTEKVRFTDIGTLQPDNEVTGLRLRGRQGQGHQVYRPGAGDRDHHRPARSRAQDRCDRRDRQQRLLQRRHRWPSSPAVPARPSSRRAGDPGGQRR